MFDVQIGAEIDDEKKARIDDVEEVPLGRRCMLALVRKRKASALVAMTRQPSGLDGGRGLGAKLGGGDPKGESGSSGSVRTVFMVLICEARYTDAVSKQSFGSSIGQDRGSNLDQTAMGLDPQQVQLHDSTRTLGEYRCIYTIKTYLISTFLDDMPP